MDIEAERRRRAPWMFIVVCWTYFLIPFYGIFRAVPIFRSLFEGLGLLEMPLLTRVLPACYWWFCPLLLLTVLGLTLVRQFRPMEKTQTRIIDACLGLVAIYSGPAMVYVLYMPLFELIHKLENLH